MCVHLSGFSAADPTRAAASALQSVPPQEGGGAPHPRAGPALLVFELHTDGLTRFAGQCTSGVKFGVLVFSVILSLSRVPGNKWEALPRPLASVVRGGCSCQRDPKPRGSNQRGLWALNRSTHTTFSFHNILFRLLPC